MCYNRVMQLSEVIAIAKFLDPRNKPVERIGAFLCRRRINALEAEVAALNDRLAERKHEVEELAEGKLDAEARLRDALGRLGFRADYRRVSVVPGVSVFALRRAAADPGDPPRLLCPVCFERGTASEILASERALLQRDRSVKKVVELKCPSSDHVFRAKVSPMAFRKAYKLVD